MAFTLTDVQKVSSETRSRRSSGMLCEASEQLAVHGPEYFHSPLESDMSTSKAYRSARTLVARSSVAIPARMVIWDVGWEVRGYQIREEMKPGPTLLRVVRPRFSREITRHHCIHYIKLPPASQSHRQIAEPVSENSHLELQVATVFHAHAVVET